MVKVRLVGSHAELSEVLKDIDIRHFTKYRAPAKGNNPRYDNCDDHLCYLEGTVATISALFNVYRDK